MSQCPHINLTDPDSFVGGHPREVYGYLRQQEPLHWHEDPAQGVVFWAVTLR